MYLLKYMNKMPIFRWSKDCLTVKFASDEKCSFVCIKKCENIIYFRRVINIY